MDRLRQVTLASLGREGKVSYDYRKAKKIQYIYQPLQDGQIRLVVLRNHGHHLVGSISVVSLGKHSNFDAISYRWARTEEEQNTEYLYCDDCTSHLRITPRLHRILTRLRSIKVPAGQSGVHVWVDAICINQNDPDERSKQVISMANIYRRADTVRVCLADRVEEPLDWYRSEWFHRRWTIQEFFAATHVVFYLPLAFTKKDPPDKSETVKDWETLFKSLESLKGPSDSISADLYRLIMTFGELRSSASKWFNVLELMQKFQYADCKDDRDRIYAFFGIASDICSLEDIHRRERALQQSGTKLVPTIGFDVDYTISVEECYMRFASAALSSAYPLDILNCAGAHRKLRNTTGERFFPISETTSLPSWAPDWRLPGLYRTLIHLKQFDRRTRYGPLETKVLANGRSISIQGFSITKVAGVDPIQLTGYSMSALLNDTSLKSSNGLRDDLRHNRILVSTDDGREVFAPRDVVPGDDIVFFPKAKTPFLLRKCSGSQEYELIGDCFLTNLEDDEIVARIPNELAPFIIV
jgi:hypothetical protein